MKTKITTNLRKQIKELKAAIKEYGVHHNSCAKVEGADYRYPCTCGLSKFVEDEIQRDKTTEGN